MKAKLSVALATCLLIAITIVRAQEPQQVQPAPQESQLQQSPFQPSQSSQPSQPSQAAQQQPTPPSPQVLSQLPPGTQNTFFLSEFFRIQRGFAIAPVPLNLHGKDLALVGLGSYLVNAMGGCNDCHTSPSYAAGGDPFAGEPKRVNAANYLAGGMAFGPFISRNLTPDANGRPAGLTYAQFEQEMRTGIDLKHVHPQISPRLQVMPWPVYQDMVDRDLRAMYEYLRAIPHAEPAPTQSGTS